MLFLFLFFSQSTIYNLLCYNVMILHSDRCQFVPYSVHSEVMSLSSPVTDLSINLKFLYFVYFHFRQLYTSTPQYHRGRYTTFYSTLVWQLWLLATFHFSFRWQFFKPFLSSESYISSNVVFLNVCDKLKNEVLLSPGIECWTILSCLRN